MELKCWTVESGGEAIMMVAKNKKMNLHDFVSHLIIEIFLVHTHLGKWVPIVSPYFIIYLFIYKYLYFQIGRSTWLTSAFWVHVFATQLAFMSMFLMANNTSHFYITLFIYLFLFKSTLLTYAMDPSTYSLHFSFGNLQNLHACWEISHTIPMSFPKC